MKIKNRKASNTTLAYIIIAVLILVIILILGGPYWHRGANLSRSIGYSHWNWVQILVSLSVGIIIGWFLHKKRR